MTTWLLGKLTGDSLPKKSSHIVLFAWYVSILRVSEGTHVFGQNHIVCAHNFGMASSSNGGNVPQIQVPILQPMAQLSCKPFLELAVSSLLLDSQLALVVKNPLANSGDIKDMGLIPGSGRSPGRGHGNPLQDSCLENPMNRGARQALVHRIAKSQT